MGSQETDFQPKAKRRRVASKSKAPAAVRPAAKAKTANKSRSSSDAMGGAGSATASCVVNSICLRPGSVDRSVEALGESEHATQLHQDNEHPDAINMGLGLGIASSSCASGGSLPSLHSRPESLKSLKSQSDSGGDFPGKVGPGGGGSGSLAANGRQIMGRVPRERSRETENETLPTASPASLESLAHSSSSDETRFCGQCCRVFIHQEATCTHGTAYPLARVPGRSHRYLPVILFSDDASKQLVWHDGSVRGGVVELPYSEPDVRNTDAVSMSPAYLGFAIEPYEKRFLQYKGVGFVFARPRRGKFMQPSIDTILVCVGLDKLFKAPGLSFSHAIDIGTGSGFIGKYMALKAPCTERLAVTCVDIDPSAEEYCHSADFAAPTTNLNGAALEWRHVTGDAVELLKAESHFDLLVSNPPYIPTLDEVESDDAIQIGNFWEGCGLLAHLLESMVEHRCTKGTHLVLMITSLTLKARRIRALLEQAPAAGVKVNILLEREIAWKAFYAGSGRGPKHLLASHDEYREKQKIGEHSYFVGACPPGRSRGGGDRDRRFDYHWHVGYVLDLHIPAAAAR
mmetsp:Transcript_34389/g.73235  ORF Transcript_34389/g.73235 Transcript_34389/m.73235 type:complete len:572 (+) Transcript_34389:208-1923(+)|eukprot:CAMPEP_0206430418 /NCGR_PEP_ID=MMETSP0324_2-20121206/6804_1 /ASSEMBLY_ACC=CAM_ASM_000836 /TAXON_ID=2866 /ORGANISM="Crypthecodinium cohnii, Strain Seligo" /LENGTH=571 /DNA_ID=CAMNT_0053896245 /DNA_START=198 /DNA_END=1913 /DNA_ORIENTATION=+